MDASAMDDTSISLEGIDKAIGGLNYKNVHSLKYKLIHALRSRYTVETADHPIPDPIHNEQRIPYEELTAVLWNIDSGTDPGQGRLKNLNIIRSAVNGDLLRGFKNGSNPEGLIIGPDFTFVMSDEAKDSFIGSFSRAFKTGGSLSIEEVVEISRRFGEFLAKIPNTEVLGFLDTIIEALGSNRPLAAQKIPEMLTLFGKLISRISNTDLLAEQDRISDLVRLLSEKAETGIKTVQMVIDGEESEKISDAGNLEEIDEDELEGIEPDEDADFEPADEEEIDSDASRDGEEPDSASATVEVMEVVEEPESTEPIPEDAADAGDLEEIDEDELEGVEPDEDTEFESADEEEIEDSDASRDGEEPDSASATVEVVEFVEEPESTEPEDAADAGDLEEIDEDELKPEKMEELEEATEVVELLDADEEAEDIPDRAAEIAVLPDFERFESPVDLFPEDDLVQNRTISAPEKKKLLSDRFNDYLGIVERHYNQYLYIPKGEYRIGSRNSLPGELSSVSISIPGFHLGKYPVTNALFEIFVDRTGYKTTAEKKGYGIVYQGRYQKIEDRRSGKTSYQWHSGIRQDRRDGAFWYQPSGPGSTLHRKRNHPVVQVSIKDAMAFASWVGKRLPTEAEWEAAARGASGNIYPWGNDWIENRCNIAESEVSDTLPVDHFSNAETESGLADLLGNTLEWTVDRFSGQDRREHYIAKGGSWISEARIQLSSRFSFPADFSANTLGFRCLAE